MPQYLVIQAARFGDLVQTKRLILSLQQKGQVCLLLDQGLVALAKLLYQGVQLYAFHFHGQLNWAKIQHNRKILQILRAEHFTQIYNCNYSPLTAALCRIFDQEIVGYRPNHASNGGILKAPFLRLAAKMTARRFCAALNLVDLWAHLTPYPLAPQLVNPVPQGQGQGIGVVLAGQNLRRSLPPTLLADMLKVYSSFYKPPIYLLGTQFEQVQAKTLLRNLPKQLQKYICDLTGKTNFQQLYDLLQQLDILLTPDTGTMHLGAAVGVPIRAFFLSSALCYETGPYGAGHIVLQSVQPCSPCLEKDKCAHAECCLEPFKQIEFLRVIAQIEQQKTNLLMPANLQCLQSKFDHLGLYFDLLHGQDQYQTLRNSQRAYIAKYLHLPIPNALVDQDATAQVDDFLADDLEWMLPQERYS